LRGNQGFPFDPFLLISYLIIVKRRGCGAGIRFADFEDHEFPAS